MVVRSAHSVTCRRDGAGWAVEVPAHGLGVRVEQIAEVEAAARDLVAAATGEDPTDCRVAVDLVADHTVAELVTLCSAVRTDPDQVSVEAVTLRRGLAHRLHAEGVEVAEVAALLGLSYPRAVQLVSDRLHAAPRAAAGRLPPLPGGADADAPGPSGRVPDSTPASHDQRARAHTAYRHEAVFYDSVEELRALTVPFVREGVQLGQPVMVALVRERLERLRHELGADAALVEWVDMAELGANPARILPAWRSFVDRAGAGGRPVRGIGEPIWSGRRPAEITECQLHEALLNLAVEPDTALWLRCPYDARALPADVLAEAQRSHPVLVDRDGYRGSTCYGGVEHARSAFAGRLPEPTAPVEEQHFDHEGLHRGAQARRDVASVRATVQRRAAAAGLSCSRRADMALAVTEAANNSLRHGGGRGTFRVWQDRDALTCEIRDTGELTDLLSGRRPPPASRADGRGLWLVNQLSDLSQVRSSADGTVVRVTSWL